MSSLFTMFKGSLLKNFVPVKRKVPFPKFCLTFGRDSLIRPVRTNPDILENAYLLPGFAWLGSYTTLESGFKTMWFPCPDSLVSCEQKANSCKKSIQFQKHLDSCGRGLNPLIHTARKIGFTQIYSLQICAKKCKLGGNRKQRW